MLRARDDSIVVTIANDLAEAAVVVEALEAFGRKHDIPHGTLVALQVCVDEIVSNVIQYAWKDAGHRLQVRMSARTGDVQVEVIDDGEPFDPLSAPEPSAVKPGSKPKPGGLGIYIVRRLMDGIEYARKGSCNHTVMTKRCTPHAHRR